MLFAIIALVVLPLNVGYFTVKGPSMEPTLHDGNLVVFRKTKTLSRGVIVLFERPAQWDPAQENHPLYVKRVVAVPGDTLSYDGESFRVNGTMVYDLKKEHYPCLKGPKGERKLSSTEFFVMGDNALHSLDSRRIFCSGAVDRSFVSTSAVVSTGHIITQF